MLIVEDAKKPLQALLIAPNDKTRKEIVNEIKTASIRKGKRDYRCGPLWLCCHVETWCVKVTVNQIIHCELQEIREKDWKASGFSSLEEAMEDLKVYYPDISPQSQVTVIHWEKPEGKLVE